MGIFRRDKVVDLTEDYNYDRKKSKAKISDNLSDPPSTEIISSNQSQESSFGGFFNAFGNTSSSGSTNVYNSSSTTTDSTETLDAEEKRKRLAIRLKNMTDRIEDLSNQIYQIQQRMEVLERKINLNRYE